MNERNSYFTRHLEDGRVIDVLPLTYKRARLTISDSPDEQVYTDGW